MLTSKFNPPTVTATIAHLSTPRRAAAATLAAALLKAVRSLRILRAIRPLRALTKSSGMRLVLKSVALSIGGAGASEDLG